MLQRLQSGMINPTAQPHIVEERAGTALKENYLSSLTQAAFGDPVLFCAAVDAYLTELRAGKKAPGVEKSRVLGERSFAERTHRLQDSIPIESRVWGQIVALANALNVTLPSL